MPLSFDTGQLKTDARMVQTPFTWRHGGREVFLSGSFNGWSERIRMNLIEGSATVFQRIMDLQPGCYQYKFLVDGTWQVDQLQICDLDEYGIMNNIVLVSGTEFMSPDFNAEDFLVTTNGANNQGMLSVKGSSCRFNEPALLLSDAEMDVFRQVLILDVEIEVEQAVHVMYEEGLRVVPLWDEHSGQMAGMLTSSDFILILLELHRNRPMLPDEELARQTISSWKDWKLQHHRLIAGTSVPLERKPLIHAGPDDSLAEVASSILQNNISSVPVVHTTDGSCPRLLQIVCLARVLKNVCQHLNLHVGYLNLLRQPVGYLPLGTWSQEFRRTNGRPLLTLHPNDSLSSALNLLLEAQISSVPIVDGMGNIVNMYSRSDIISLAKNNIFAQIQIDQTTISQALEISGEARRDRLQTCSRFDSLYRVMELLSEPDTRRVIVVEACTSHVEGVITLRDVFHFFSR